MKQAFLEMKSFLLSKEITTRFWRVSYSLRNSHPFSKPLFFTSEVPM
jgi:hypothetical protein